MTISMRKSVSGKQKVFQHNKTLYFICMLIACCLFPARAYSGEVFSRAAVVMDASTGKILYAKNPDLKCLPASTTKLMTAIVAIENKDLKDVVTISRNASLTPPHKAGLKAGDRVTVEELLYAALIGSANDAAVALAEAVAGSEARFVELMNRKAAAIGAIETKFINPNGLPGPGQHITASDLARIMNYSLRYPKLKEIIGTRVAEISTEKGKAIFLKNTNRLLWSDEDLVGGKTGFTQKARHCFVCAAERGNDTVLVALLGSPSRSYLWRESEILINKGFEVMANRENPAIYLAKADDITAIEKTSYRKNAKSKHGSKVMAKKKTKHCEVKMLAKKKTKHCKVKMLAKKGKTKIFAKGKSKKNYRVAKRGSVERNKV
jgi:serine-type D-Ala-D-Ala carboxypeptidase (penicillin-binding protein 5/6)